MVVDTLEKLSHYCRLNPLFGKVCGFLAANDLNSLAEGWHGIEGEDAYVMVQRENCRRAEDANLEAHRKYIDIQICLEGLDRIGWRPLADCVKPMGEYEPEDDLIFFEDEPAAWIDLPPGRFVMLFPGDVHMPLVGSGQVRKLVVKVRDASPDAD